MRLTGEVVGEDCFEHCEMSGRPRGFDTNGRNKRATRVDGNGGPCPPGGGLRTGASLRAGGRDRDEHGRLALMELELIEPELFFRLHGPAANALAGEVANALA